MVYEKLLYFRTQNAIGSDDASNDSCMFPLSKLRGMVPSAADTLNIYFDPMIPEQHDDQNGSVINADYVVVSLSANNTHKDVIERLTRLFHGTPHKDPFLSVADDVTGVYAVEGISGLSTISVAAAVS